MCGVFGYTGSRPATPLLLEGLGRLEYRGYDSAGICVASPNGRADLQVMRSAGKLSALRKRVMDWNPEGFAGMGHTRWATHGPPTEANAQPLVSGAGRVATVQNGIVENHDELRGELSDRGFSFSSDTDAECIPHLIELYMSEGMNLAAAVRSAAARLRGANAVVAMSADDPNRLVAMRIGHAGGLVIGAGQGETLVASDVGAITPHTDSVYYLGSGEVAEISAGGVRITDLKGSVITRAPSQVERVSNSQRRRRQELPDSELAARQERGRCGSTLHPLHAQGDKRTARGPCPCSRGPHFPQRWIGTPEGSADRRHLSCGR